MPGSGEETIDVGHRIGPYRLDELLGQGSMGAVFRASRDGSQAPVALKVIRLPISFQEEAHARLRREVEILANLDHPGIVRFHEVFHEGGVTAIAMEHVPGVPLSRVISAGTLPIRSLFRLACEVIDSLEHAWCRHGIVHRDVKPSNILVSMEEKAKLVDFGLARSMEHDMGASTVTLSGTILGTPHYMAPEQAMGKRVDFRADLYSVGVILYQMVAGRLPFTGSSPLEVILKHRDQAVRFSPSEERRLPPELRGHIATFLAKLPADRPRDFAHAKALLRDSLQLLEKHPVSPPSLDQTLPVEIDVTLSSRPGSREDTRMISTLRSGPIRRWRTPELVGRVMMFGLIASLAILLPRMTLTPAQALNMPAPPTTSPMSAGVTCPGGPPAPDVLPLEYTCMDDFPDQAAGMTPGVCSHPRSLQMSVFGGEPPVQNSHRSFRALFAEAARLLAAGDRSERTERLARKVEFELDLRVDGLITQERLFDLSHETRQAMSSLRADCKEAKERLRTDPAGSLEWFVARWEAAPVPDEEKLMLENVFLMGDLPALTPTIHRRHHRMAHAGKRP